MRALLWLGLWGLSACRSQTLPGGEHVVPSTAPVTPSASASPLVPTHSPSRLYLPIAEVPFPDGATDDRVCAAVHSAEQDPFFRFGHLLPVFKDGVAWIGQGSPEELKATSDAIDRYEPKMFLSRSATCSRGGVLVYVEGLAEQVTATLGRQYSLAELEAGVLGNVPAAKAVLKDRFLLSEKSGLPQLLAICREHAERCDQLMRLWPIDEPTAPRGLCNQVVSEARSLLEASDRSWATRADVEWDERAVLVACSKLQPADKVCAVISSTRAERSACWKQLAPKLGW